MSKFTVTIATPSFAFSMEVLQLISDWTTEFGSHQDKIEFQAMQIITLRAEDEEEAQEAAVELQDIMEESGTDFAITLNRNLQF